MSGKGVVLIRIIRRKGSAPRDVGSACMVDADGRLFGSIGGGLLEHKAIAKAMGLIKQQKTSTEAIELTAESVEEKGCNRDI